MNRLHRHNQRVLANALGKPLLITSIDVSGGRFIDVRTATWEEYWASCDCVAEEIECLHRAWNAFITGGYSVELRSAFVSAYFAVLRRCLKGHFWGEIDSTILRKVVGFESFAISCEQGHLAAGIFNIRNPVYLLSRVARPNAPEDPKFLPLICPPGNLTEDCQLFCHYRRIGISGSPRAQLFVYPPADVRHRSASYWLIAELFASLTSKNDPWVQERTRLLFDGVFASLVAPHAGNRIQLLDIACASAKTTMKLCRRAFDKFGTSFDLSLVDVVRGAASIATAFHRNPRVFGNVIFRHESLFDWIERSGGAPSFHFDLILMLRIWDVFSTFRIAELCRREARALIQRERGDFFVDANMTCPATLIEENKLDRLHHRLWRTPFRNGMIFHQFSLSDYFGAIKCVLGDELSGIEDTIYAPIRRFDEAVLVLPGGRSLIGELMAMTDNILVEDCDLTANRLRRHINLFGLNDLSVTDLSDRRGRRGASVVVIGKRRLPMRCTRTTGITVTSGVVAERRQ